MNSKQSFQLSSEMLKDILKLASGRKEDLKKIQKKHIDISNIDEFNDIIKSFLQENYYTKTEIQKLVDKAGNILLKYASNKFSEQIKLTDDETLDALISSINFLGEELNFSTVTTHYLNDIFNSIEDIIIVVNKSGNMLYMNSKGKKLLGFKEIDIRGHSIDMFVQSEAVKNLLLQSHRKPISIEFVSCKGVTIPVSVKVSVFARTDNPMMGHVILARDISSSIKQQKEIELKNKKILEVNKELKISENRFRRTIEFSPIPMIVANMIKDELYVNKKFTDVFGYLATDFNSISDLLSLSQLDNAGKEAIREDWLEKMDKAAKENTGTPTGEYELHCKNGEIKTAEVSMTPEKDMFIMIFNDITVKKNAENRMKNIRRELELNISERTKELLEKNKQLKDELFLREKMIEAEKELGRKKSQFISVVSHEFRTPLSGIITGIQLLDRYGDKWPDPRKKEVFNEIYKAFDHLNYILNDISIVSNVETEFHKTKKELIVIHQFCKSAVESIYSVFGNNTKIKIRCNPPDISITSDLSLFKHIIYNILSNAVKFNNNDNIVTLNVEKKSENIIFEIKDKGMGIAESDLDDIFEMFYRGKNTNTVHGAGIGLAITKKSIDLLGGTIQIKSKENIGTTVTFAIPLIQETK
jgi:PAS domain S-box-containing protein